MSSGTKHIVGFSGGIDSQACARWVLNRFPKEDVILTNSNAGGNEHPLTDEFVGWYSANVHPVVKVNGIIADMWVTPGFAETKGYDSNAELTFETMIRIKGRSPSRKAQFCTEKLKLAPQKRWINQTFGPGGEFEGWDYVRYTGVRRDESGARSQTPYQQWDDWYDCPLFAPLMDWPKQFCFDFIKAHGEQINPLYAMGFNRVGCAPCINSSKEDILNWHMRAPEMIDKIRGWEERTQRTFFAPCVPGKHTNTVDEVVEWAKTSRGGAATAVPDLPRARSVREQVRIMRMTNEPTNTARLRELLAGATKGPRKLALNVYVDAERGSKKKSVARFEKHLDAKAYAELHNAAPALLDELDALKEQVQREIRTWEVEREKAQGANGAALEATTKLVEVEAERDELRARVAGLREAGQAVIDRWESPHWKDFPPTADCMNGLRSALASTPAKHAARIVAAGLRETANRLHPHIDRETLLAEAERLEKEVGNG